jgi:hypothetical protein
VLKTSSGAGGFDLPPGNSSDESVAPRAYWTCGSDPKHLMSGTALPGIYAITSEWLTTVKLPAKPHAQVIYFFRVSNHLITIDCSSMRRSEKL